MKNKWIWVVISVILVLGGIYYVVYRAPYNLQDKWKENSFGILNMSSFMEIDELANYFNGDKIINVKYIGSDTYEVSTNRGEFIVIADYKGFDYWKYKIFKYDEEVYHFTNPM